MTRSVEFAYSTDDMTLKTMLNERNLSMYRLSQLSGVPKTTVIDICSGKSAIAGCTAKTVYQLAKVLNCPMEELMKLDASDYDAQTGLPKDQTYLEKGLPPYLARSLEAMKRSWAVEDHGEADPHWDAYWCELNADINAAENEHSISNVQARYLRRVYLRMEETE